MAKAVKIHDVATGSGRLASGGGMAAVSGAGVTLVDTNTTQTLTNKTLTTPTIASLTNTTLTTPTIATPSITNATLGVFYQTLAGTGSAIGDSAEINSTVGAVLVTAANNSVGVKLPVASAGRIIFLKNADAANDVLKVYPQVNSTINAIAANGSLDMAAKTSAVFMGTSATNWVTIPLLPS